MSKLLSIIIPVYNVEKYIRECFESIKIQKTGENVEIICIDDGSTDRSGFICDEYANLDKRFRVIHQKNKGISYTRNLGVKMAKGKYLAWIDPDDYIDKYWWDSIKDLLLKDIDMIFFDYIILKDDQYVYKCFSNKSRFIDKELFLKEIVVDRKIKNQLWQKIFKKSLMQNVSFPENISLMEDYAVLHKIVLKVQKIYYLSKKIYFYRIRKNSIATELSIDKSYKAYLIAKERYNYLLEKNINVSKIGYLMQALILCTQYYKINKQEQKLNKKVYDKCKKEIDENIKYILSLKICNFKLKIKFLLCKIKVLRIVLYIKNMLTK